MSKEHKERQKHHTIPNSHEHADNRGATVHTVRIQKDPEDQQRNTKEQEYWGKQVEQAKRLNLISLAAAIIALLALAGLVLNAILLHNEVSAIQLSNKINMESFQATERPWLSVDVKPENGLSYVHGEQAVLPIKVSIKNVGRSIAKNIQVRAKLFPTSPSIPLATDAAKNQAKVCDNPRSLPLGRFDLFPTDAPAEQVMDISAIPSAIAAQSIVHPGSSPRRFVGFYIVGCVIYRSSFGGAMHRTRFAYHLAGPPITSSSGTLPLILPNGMPVVMGFEVGINVPKKKVQMMRELLGHNDAN